MSGDGQDSDVGASASVGENPLTDPMGVRPAGMSGLTVADVVGVQKEFQVLREKVYTVQVGNAGLQAKGAVFDSDTEKLKRANEELSGHLRWLTETRGHLTALCEELATRNVAKMVETDVLRRKLCEKAVDKFLAETPDELFEALTGMPKMTVEFAREMGAALGGPDDGPTLPAAAANTEAPGCPPLPSVVRLDDSPPPPLHPGSDSGAVGGPPGPAAESQRRGLKPLHEDIEVLQRKVADLLQLSESGGGPADLLEELEAVQRRLATLKKVERNVRFVRNRWTLKNDAVKATLKMLAVERLELIEQMGRVEAQIFELKGQRDAAVALLPANTQNVGRLLGKLRLPLRCFTLTDEDVDDMAKSLKLTPEEIRDLKEPPTPAQMEALNNAARPPV